MHGKQGILLSMISRNPKLIGFDALSAYISATCVSQLFLVSLLQSAQILPYNSKHAVLRFRSWPEPLLQVDRMASCKPAQRQQLPLAAALQSHATLAPADQVYQCKQDVTQAQQQQQRSCSGATNSAASCKLAQQSFLAANFAVPTLQSELVFTLRI